MERTVRVRGRGRVEVAAYGIADAEHLVEKEIRARWPAARVLVEEVARAGAARIVEELTVSYRIEGTLEVDTDDAALAPAAAFRRARGMFAGSRYERTEWERAG